MDFSRVELSAEDLAFQQRDWAVQLASAFSFALTLACSYRWCRDIARGQGEPQVR